MTSALIELSIDQKLRDDAEAVCAEFGMDLETAVKSSSKNWFLRTACRSAPRRIPSFRLQTCGIYNGSMMTIWQAATAWLMT